MNGLVRLHPALELIYGEKLGRVLRKVLEQRSEKIWFKFAIMNDQILIW